MPERIERDARQTRLFVSRWRQRFFAEGAEAAMRYQVSFDDVLAHLDQALRRRTHLPACAVANFDDLVHVTACRLGSRAAWGDFHERFERVLVRCCRTHLLHVNPVVHVRRTLSRMKEGAETDVPQLVEYAGATPLRDWLLGRFVDGMTDHRTDASEAWDMAQSLPAAGLNWAEANQRDP